MSISSLGVGSSILTQDVIDKLKKADESQFVTPLNTKLSNEKNKSGQLDIVNALMDNLSESTGNVADFGLFNKRTADASGTAVSVTANDGSDIQDFTIKVNTLATKEIDESGTFTSATDSVATGSGQMQLDVGSVSFTFDYTSATTLTDLKDTINKKAGDSAKASIVQVASGDYRLFLTAANTGSSQTISITDVVGKGENLKDALTSDVTNVQTAKDASFDYNGVTITRESNSISDLLSGVTVTLKEEGSSSDVTVKQDVNGIEDKLNKFVEKYNATITQLDKMTKSSKDTKDRGIFANDSTIKGMKRDLENMLYNVGGVEKLTDYGFSLNRDGTMALDKSAFETKLSANPQNVEAFFSGGTYTKSDGSTTTIDGAFDAVKSKIDMYAKYQGSLDQLKTSFTTRITSLNDQRDLATKRLNDKYAIMAKRFASYDAMINKINNASDIFTQLANAQAVAAKS